MVGGRYHWMKVRSFDFILRYYCCFMEGYSIYIGKKASTFFLFFFLDPAGDPGKKSSSSIHFRFVYQFSSMCRTQTLC